MPLLGKDSSRTRGALLLGVLTIIVGAVFAFAWLADEMLEGDTRAFDGAVRGWAHGFAAPAMTSGMQAVSRLGSVVVLTIAGVVVVAVSLYRRRKRDAVLVTAALAGSAVLGSALKYAFQRTRPIAFVDASPVSFSFPSGHALGAFCFYGAMALILSAQVRGRVAQVGIHAAAFGLIVLIGFSRIYLGVHYPSDVVAGYAVAAAWLWAVAYFGWYER